MTGKFSSRFGLLRYKGCREKKGGGNADLIDRAVAKWVVEAEKLGARRVPVGPGMIPTVRSCCMALRVMKPGFQEAKGQLVVFTETFINLI